MAALLKDGLAEVRDLLSPSPPLMRAITGGRNQSSSLSFIPRAAPSSFPTHLGRMSHLMRLRAEGWGAAGGGLAAAVLHWVLISL